MLPHLIYLVVVALSSALNFNFNLPSFRAIRERVQNNVLFTRTHAVPVDHATIAKSAIHPNAAIETATPITTTSTTASGNPYMRTTSWDIHPTYPPHVVYCPIRLCGSLPDLDSPGPMDTWDATDFPHITGSSHTTGSSQTTLSSPSIIPLEAKPPVQAKTAPSSHSSWFNPLNLISAFGKSVLHILFDNASATSASSENPGTVPIKTDKGLWERIIEFFSAFYYGFLFFVLLLLLFLYARLLFEVRKFRQERPNDEQHKKDRRQAKEAAELRSSSALKDHENNYLRYQFEEQRKEIEHLKYISNRERTEDEKLFKSGMTLAREGLGALGVNDSPEDLRKIITYLYEDHVDLSQDIHDHQNRIQDLNDDKNKLADKVQNAQQSKHEDRKAIARLRAENEEQSKVIEQLRAREVQNSATKLGNLITPLTAQTTPVRAPAISNALTNAMPLSTVGQAATDATPTLNPFINTIKVQQKLENEKAIAANQQKSSQGGPSTIPLTTGASIQTAFVTSSPFPSQTAASQLSSALGQNQNATTAAQQSSQTPDPRGGLLGRVTWPTQPSTNTGNGLGIGGLLAAATQANNALAASSHANQAAPTSSALQASYGHAPGFKFAMPYLAPPVLQSQNSGQINTTNTLSNGFIGQTIHSALVNSSSDDMDIDLIAPADEDDGEEKEMEGVECSSPGSSSSSQLGSSWGSNGFSSSFNSNASTAASSQNSFSKLGGSFGSNGFGSNLNNKNITSTFTQTTLPQFGQTSQHLQYAPNPAPATSALFSTFGQPSILLKPTTNAGSNGINIPTAPKSNIQLPFGGNTATDNSGASNHNIGTNSFAIGTNAPRRNAAPGGLTMTYGNSTNNTYANTFGAGLNAPRTNATTSALTNNTYANTFTVGMNAPRTNATPGGLNMVYNAGNSFAGSTNTSSLNAQQITIDPPQGSSIPGLGSLNINDLFNQSLTQRKAFSDSPQYSGLTISGLTNASTSNAQLTNSVMPPPVRPQHAGISILGAAARSASSPLSRSVMNSSRVPTSGSSPFSLDPPKPKVAGYDGEEEAKKMKEQYDEMGYDPDELDL